MKIFFAVTHSEAGRLVEIWNDLAGGLRERGHVTHCFALYPNVRSAPSPLGWTHIAPVRPGTPWSASALLVGLVRYLREERPDIVVTAMPAANILLPLAVTLSGRSIPIVTSHHSPASTHNRLFDMIDGWTGQLSCVKAIVSVSAAVARSFSHKARAYRAKSRIIHNALPPAIEALVERLSCARTPLRTAERRIVALGRLSHQKNYPLILAAMVHVPGVHLDIIGAGEEAEVLRELASTLDISARVTFLGHMSRVAALQRAAQADIFVQVSHYEGHSLALIEAARLGLPLVVSDVPVQVEGITLRDGTICGQIVPLNNPAALGAKLVELLENPELYALFAKRSRALGLEASHSALLDRYEAMIEADV